MLTNTQELRLKKLDTDLCDAWMGEGNAKNITFLRWVREMADNEQGILQKAAIEYIELRKLMLMS